MSDEPKIKRRYPSDRDKLLIYTRQNGRDAITGEKLGHYLRQTQYDHNPALKLRPLNAAKTDYDPPQLDMRFIFAVSKKTHNVKTNGDPAIEKRHLMRKDYDKARIGKVKRIREDEAEFKQRQASKGAGKIAKPKSKWPSRPFVQRKDPWGKR